MTPAEREARIERDAADLATAIRVAVESVVPDDGELRTRLLEAIGAALNELAMLRLEQRRKP